MTPPWTVLVPVKSTAIGKSRIGLGAEARVPLARAMAQDTVEAVAAATRVRLVVVLVEDPDDARLLECPPIIIAHQVSVAGLNESIREGAGLPELDGDPVAVLPADLPSLRPAELDEALAWAASYPRAVVADREGSGTTLLTAREAALLDPRYGPGSFAAHCASGAVAVPVAAQSGLRRDVDVAADLREADGARTRAWLAGRATETGVFLPTLTKVCGD